MNSHVPHHLWYFRWFWEIKRNRNIGLRLEGSVMDSFLNKDFSYAIFINRKKYSAIIKSSNNFLMDLVRILGLMAPWCSGYHYCKTSLNKAWIQVLRRLKSCSRFVGDSRWWGSLTVVLAGNKAKGLSSVNHTTNNSLSWLKMLDSLFISSPPEVFW